MGTIVEWLVITLAILTGKRAYKRKPQPVSPERKVELIRLHIKNGGQVGWVRELADEELAFLADYFTMVGGVPKEASHV